MGRANQGDYCLSGKEKVNEEDPPSRGSLVLVEFKVPGNLLEEFDSKWKSSRFSTRSEAIRFLIRAFVEKASKRSEYAVKSVGEGV